MKWNKLIINNFDVLFRNIRWVCSIQYNLYFRKDKKSKNLNKKKLMTWVTYHFLMQF